MIAGVIGHSRYETHPILDHIDDFMGNFVQNGGVGVIWPGPAESMIRLAKIKSVSFFFK